MRLSEIVKEKRETTLLLRKYDEYARLILREPASDWSSPGAVYNSLIFYMSPTEAQEIGEWLTQWSTAKLAARRERALRRRASASK